MGRGPQVPICASLEPPDVCGVTNGDFSDPVVGLGWAVPGTGTLQASRLEAAAPWDCMKVPLSLPAFGPNDSLEKDTGMALAGGTCFLGVWLTFKDNEAPGCWKQPIRRLGCGWQGCPFIYDTTHCQGAGRGCWALLPRVGAVAEAAMPVSWQQPHQTWVPFAELSYKKGLGMPCRPYPHTPPLFQRQRLRMSDAT